MLYEAHIFCYACISKTDVACWTYNVLYITVEKRLCSKFAAIDYGKFAGSLRQLFAGSLRQLFAANLPQLFARKLIYIRYLNICRKFVANVCCEFAANIRERPLISVRDQNSQRPTCTYTFVNP